MAYAVLFLTALVAATIIPAQSEAMLTGLLLWGDHSTALLLLAATTGNVAGSLFNWFLGRSMLQFQNRRWFPFREAQLAKAVRWYERYGRWSLLLSWVPFIGDPITVVAGMLREKPGVFLLLVTFAKGLRYLVIAAIVLHG